MTVAEVKAALANIEKTIPGVKRALASAPLSIPPGDLPLFINFAGPASVDWEVAGAEYGVESRLYVARLYIKPVGQGIDGEAERIADPFFELVRDKFGSKPMLGLQTVETQQSGIDAVFLGDQGLAEILYAGEAFIGIEFRLQVEALFGRTYDKFE